MAAKCQECNKKSHILLRCQCEKLLCLLHRNHIDHKCTIDPKKALEQNKQTLLGTLVSVAKPKLDLI